MKTDLPTLMLANMFFALQLTPGVLVAVTIIRGALLLRGRKREFEDWTRNPLMTFLSILFLPGTVVYIGIRYIVAKAGRLKVERVAGSTTYGELNLFLVVENPPSLGRVLVVLYATLVLTVFVAVSLLMLPLFFLIDMSITLILWYVAIGTFYNSSFRSGDASLVFSSLKEKPRRGIIELLVFVVILIIGYSYLLGVIVL